MGQNKDQCVYHLKWKSENNLHALKTYVFPHQLKTTGALGLSGMMFKDFDDPFPWILPNLEVPWKYYSQICGVLILTKLACFKTLPKALSEQLLPETSSSKIISSSNSSRHHVVQNYPFIFLSDPLVMATIAPSGMQCSHLLTHALFSHTMASPHIRSTHRFVPACSKERPQ